MSVGCERCVVGVREVVGVRMVVLWTHARAGIHVQYE